MKHNYCIGDVVFQISSEINLDVPAMFQKFEVVDVIPKYYYEIQVVGELPAITDHIVANREDLVVEDTTIGENRLIGMKGCSEYYAYYSEITSCSSKILLNSCQLDRLHMDPIFTSLLALERRMMESNKYILHCAYVKYKDEAILFSAPSETGKTTQANLWENYRQSRTINGDRALLSFSDQRLIANGWPVCGSSEICENESTPVRAIVMLSQGKENKIRQLHGREAFMMLYSQITINSWNQEFLNRGIDFIEQIINLVPVYHLSCTISIEAVEILEAELYAK